MRFPKTAFIKYIKYALAFFEISLGLRFLLRILGASATAPIVDFFYTLTDVMASPFRGIFQNVTFRSGGVLDLVTVAAMVGYPVVVYLVMELVHLITKHDTSHAVFEEEKK